MSQRDDLDRLLGVWIDDPYAAPSSRILDRVLEQTRHTRQRRAWPNLERWLPMTVITRPALAPPLRLAWLLLLVILTVALAGGVAIVGSRMLTAPAPQSVLPAVAVIPQGGDAVLAFDSDGDIFTVRADGTDLRQLTEGPAVERNPSWSPDGTRLAYMESGSVVILDAGGDRTTLVTPDSSNDCLADWAAAWSPDGTSLVVPTSDCFRYDLVIVPADGSSAATRLVADGLESVSAAWSPDGTQIAFQGTDEATGLTGAYVIDVGDGGALQGGFQARRIADGPGPDLGDAVSVPQWSRDGLELAVVAGTSGACYASSEQTWDVIVVKADGSGQRALAAGPLHEYNPAWSPDGKQLAFHRTVEPSEYWDGRPCTVRTWLIDADGTNERRLDALQNNWPPPLWSPDGTRLVGGLIDPPAAPGETNPFHLSIFTIDGSTPPVTLGHAGSANWQPVAAPLPSAPSSPAASSAP